MIPMRCRGCRRRLGVATAPVNGAYCTEMCAADAPASYNEARDDLLELRVRLGAQRAKLIEEFGLTKQRLSQVLAKRMGVAA